MTVVLVLRICIDKIQVKAIVHDIGSKSKAGAIRKRTHLTGRETCLQAGCIDFEIKEMILFLDKGSPT